MTAKIDIVGYFGTTFSYATVASRVARDLLSRGRLGTVTNFDEEWHPEHADLRQHTEQEGPQHGNHVFVACAPEHHFGSYASLYGKRRSAIFVSPNNDDMDDQHALLISSFGLAVAPSEWCANAADRALRRVAPESSTEVVVCGLGVDDDLLARRHERIENLRRRAMMGDESEVVLLHLSTDQRWASRKGTSELIEAFAEAFPHGRVPVKLKLHVQPALRGDAHQAVRKSGLKGSVDVLVPGGKRGDRESLSDLFDAADVLVAPSVCEGFGIMMASSLVAGVPLLCTSSTGQFDYLEQYPGWLSIPAGPPKEYLWEAGRAPSLSVDTIARSLELVTKSSVRLHLLEQLSKSLAWEDMLWSRAANRFADRLIEWAEGEP